MRALAAIAAVALSGGDIHFRLYMHPQSWRLNIVEDDFGDVGTVHGEKP
jgi:hypothetical protein